MLQIEVICFGLAVEVERLQHQHKQLNAQLDRYSVCLNSILNSLDMQSQDAQQNSREYLNDAKIQLNGEKENNGDLVIEITKGKSNFEDVKNVIDELKHKSRQYLELLQALDGQDINEVISKAEQYTIQRSINQELNDRLEEYPKIVTQLKEDADKNKVELLKLQLLVNDQDNELQEINQLNIQLQQQIDSRQDINFQSAQITTANNKDQEQIENLSKIISELQEKLEAADTESENLSEELEQIAIFKTQMELQIQELIKSNSLLLKQNDELNVANNFLEESDNKNKELNKLQEEKLKEKNQTIQKQQGIIEHLQIEVGTKNSLQIEVGHQQQVIEQLNDRLSIYFNEVEEVKCQSQKKLEYELHQSNSSIEQLEKKLKLKEDKILQLSTMLEHMKETYENRQQQDYAKLKEQLNFAQQDVQQLQREKEEQLEKSQYLSDEQQKKISDLLGIIAKNEKQINQCQTIQKQQIQSLIDSQGEQSLKHSKEVNQLQLEISQSNVEQQKLLTELEQYGNHIMELEAESQELSMQLSDKEKEIDVQKVLIKKIQESNSVYNATINELEEKIRELEFQSGNLQKIGTQNSEEIRHLSSKCKEQGIQIEKSNQSFQEQKEFIESELEQSHQQVKQLTLDITDITDENQQQHQINLDLQQQLQLSSFNQQELQQQQKKLEQINVELTQQIYSMKFEINTYQIQITNLTQLSEKSELELRSSQTTGETELNELYQKILQFENTIKEQDQIIQDGSQRVSILQSDNLTLESEIAKLNKKLEEQEIFIQQLQLELSQPAVSSEALESLQQRYDELDTEYTQFWDEYQKIKLDQEQSLEKQQQHQQELDEANQRISDLQIFNAKITSEIQSVNEQFYEKDDQLNQKKALIDKFNLKIMNQNTEICQLKQQILSFETNRHCNSDCSTFYSSQIFELQQTIEKLKLEQQSQMIDGQLETRLTELSRLNLELSKVVDERSGKVKTLQNEIEVYDCQIKDLNKYIQNLEIQIQDIRNQKNYSEGHQLTQNYNTNQSQCSHSMYDTPYSSDAENDDIANKLRINELRRQLKEKTNLYQELKQQYETLFRQHSLSNNSNEKLQDYENKIALLSLEVSRYRNSSKVNSPYINSQRQLNIKTREFLSGGQASQENSEDQNNSHLFQKESVEDYLCLIFLLIAEVESLRQGSYNTQEEGKNRVQNIINYYRSRKQ